MDEQVILILLAVAFWVFRAFFGKKDEKKKPRRRQPQRPNTTKKKTFQEILQELTDQAEGKNMPKQRKIVDERKPVFKAAPTPIKKPENLDWQQVSKSKLTAKKQLIRHEDYHKVHDLIDDLKPIEEVETIADSEGQVFYFDKNSIDWKKALITKEILDRKYV